MVSQIVMAVTHIILEVGSQRYLALSLKSPTAPPVVAGHAKNAAIKE